MDNDQIADLLDKNIYGPMRKIQASHDQLEFKCIGSGNCCRVGLRIPLLECFNIARNIQRQYFILAEREGFESANKFYKSTIDALIARMFDETWQENGESERTCAFLGKNGCGIYEYRPLVCRAYGTIMPVAVTCPRKRKPDGTIPLFRDEEVEDLIDNFEAILKQWYESNDDSMGYSVYMPMGVLRFLLSKDQITELYSRTDPKFWKGIAGYSHRFRPKDWVD